jgi:hypothetical protein
MSGPSRLKQADPAGIWANVATPAYQQVKGRLDVRVTDFGASQLRNTAPPIFCSPGGRIEVAR